MPRPTNEELENLKTKLEKIITQANDIFSNIQEKQSDIETINSEIENIQTQINQILQNTEQSEQTINGRVEALNRLLGEIESKLTEAKTYHQEIESLRNTSNDLKTEIESILNELKPQINKNNELSQELEDKIEKLKKQCLEVETLFENAQSNTETTKNLKIQSETSFSEIDNYHKILFDDNFKEDELCIRNKIEDTKNEIEKYLEDLTTTSQEILETKKEILGYKETDEDGKEIEYSGLKHSFDELYENNIKKLKELTDRMENLLPRATTTGLASSYEASYQIHKGHAGDAHKSFFNIILFLMGVAVITLAINIGKQITWLPSGNEWFEPLLTLFMSLPFILPLTWLALSQQRTMRIHQRMAEEYLHKKNLALSYMGFKEMTENLREENPDSELHEMLLGITIEAKRRNASITMDSTKNSSDHPISEMMQGSWREAIGLRKKTKKSNIENIAENAIEETPGE